MIHYEEECCGGLGGVIVPLDPWFMGSDPAEVMDF
jgi:hypothetical protein